MKLPGESGEGGSRKHLLIAIAVAIVATGYYFVSRELGSLDLQGLLEDISNTLGAWTYLLVGFFAFAETGAFVGLVVPGETTMLLGGAVAGQGAIDLYLLIAIAWFAAWLGDTTSFFLGRRLGREFVLQHGPRVGISHERFEKVEDYFSRHGGKTIFIGRFISLVRAFAPFIAGSSGMRYRAFVPYSILGTGLWASAHILVGYFFSRSVETGAEYAGKGAFLLGTLIVVVGGSIFLYRHFRQRGEPASARCAGWRPTRRPAGWSCSAAASGRSSGSSGTGSPPAAPSGSNSPRWSRSLAVALFVLVAYTVLIGRRPRADPRRHDRDRNGRKPAAGLADRPLQGRHLPRLRRFHLEPDGALRGGADRPPPLGRVRRPARGNDAGLDRLPRDQGRGRPAAARAEAWSTPPGSSFPSGHAAHSVLYVWLAVTIVLRLRPGMARGAVVFAAGLALTVLVGLSRVYLNVHYLSDVSGGWALGVACFSLCALVGLVVSASAPKSPAMTYALARNRRPVPALRRRRADLPGRFREPDPGSRRSARYGRIWEKAAAGFLSVFVLAALVLVGVVIGLVIVYYYNDISNFVNGS